MDVVQAAHEAIESGGETKMTENNHITEASDSEKIKGAGMESRSRRRSKYLSYPYTNSGAKHKDLPAETEELRTPSVAHKAKASSKTSNKSKASSKTTKPSNGSASVAKLGNKRFLNNWYRKFISSSSMSSSPEFINASSGDLLSGLNSIAVDCMSSIEDKSFDLVEWFVCRYRISKYHNEAELATSLVNMNGGESGKPGNNDQLDTKSEKKRKTSKTETTVKRKVKSLAGLSDVNTNTNASTDDSTKSGKKLNQKRKMEEITSLHHMQKAEATLNESGNQCSSVPETLQNLNCATSEGNTRPKKKQKLEAAKEHECAQFTGNFTMSRVKLTPKRKVQGTSLHQLKKVETTSNGSGNIYTSVPEIPQNLTCFASVGKAKPKKRVKMEATQEHKCSQFASHVDAKNIGCSSLVIDLQFTPQPIPVDVHAKSNGENKEELVFLGSNPEIRVSQDGLAGNVAATTTTTAAPEVGTASQEGLVVGNITNHNLFVNAVSVSGSVSQEGSVGNITNHNMWGGTASAVGVVSVNKTVLKKKAEKVADEHPNPNAKHATEIPDLNGTAGFESFPIRKERETVNFLSLDLKSDNPRTLSACSRHTKTVNFDRLEENGESTGTCIFLQFASGVDFPTKEDLLTTFYRFGPLKASDTQLMKDTNSARVAFVRSTDAAEAFQSLEQNKPFSATLLDYRLDHLPVAASPVERLVTPTQPNKSMSMPGKAPPSLEFMKQNLEKMTLMLEKSGNNLSPQVRAKLDAEIKNLLRKVNSKAQA